MAGVGEKGKWVMGIDEGTCWDEDWVLYLSDEHGNLLPKPRAHCIHCMLANLTISIFGKQNKKKNEADGKNADSRGPSRANTC